VLHICHHLCIDLGYSSTKWRELVPRRKDFGSFDSILQVQGGAMPLATGTLSMVAGSYHRHYDDCFVTTNMQ